MATELEAVNEMLRAVGQVPVTSITASSPRAVLLAQAEWQAAMKEIQTMGWHWNTILTISNEPDGVTSQISLPSSYLHVDVDPQGCDRTRDIVQVSGILYDRENDTDEFDSTLELLAVIERPIDEIPEVFYQWMVKKATRRFHAATHGDPQRDRQLRADEEEARAAARTDEMRTRDGNALKRKMATLRNTHKYYY